MPDARKRCKPSTHAHMELAGTFYARSAIPRVDRTRGAAFVAPQGSSSLEHVSMQSLEVRCSQLAWHSCRSFRRCLARSDAGGLRAGVAQKKSTSPFREVGARWSSEVSLVAYSERWWLCCHCDPLGDDDVGRSVGPLNCEP